MDHTCPSCGLAVADGTPFCSGCRAPQIRFVPPEPAESSPRADVRFEEVLPAPTPLVWRPAVYSAFLGGVFSAFAMNFLGGLLGLGFIAGGTIAVYAYRRRVPGAVVGLGSGSLLGAVSGLFGFLVFCALATLEILLSHKGEELRRTLFESLDKVALNAADPQLQQQFQELIQHFKTPEGFALFLALTSLFLCLIFIFFSILGGAIGSSITRRSPQ